ncbi:nucleotidyltransferase family protein [Clostridium sp. SM-530-WT-3G]|uniref:nucleotidyltransferase domain-containing protein n=1 Tax=Clostridium sp. SM-530-WT-3G TaxID=2725303 RepID=UPI00145ED2DE|nr:nucleotidyltransferase family protein [Clostridium sp. SM-530-WT-3G]NME82443.1 nucleotidyltransferase family protein [Clostridium sp. SM-530-WT-3G]
MNYEQTVLIDILKKSINNEKITDLRINSDAWENIIKEIHEQNIDSLAYYTLDKNIIRTINSDLREEWKRKVFTSNMIQIKHTREIKQVLSRFNEEGVEAIVLKGLVLRKLYHKPELRSMSDADILVKKEQYSKAVECLNECGYTFNGHSNDIHEAFVKPNTLEIELHHKLGNSGFIGVDFSQFEENLWNNSIETEIEGVITKTLSNKDFIIHQILHMATHTKYYGFGIRLIYDFALFIKENYDDINWAELKNELCRYELLKYTEGIMMVTNKLLDIEIPEIFLNNNITKKDIDIFIDNIMNVGVHGKKQLNPDYDILFKSRNHHKEERAILKRIILFICPKGEYLLMKYPNKYEYIRKNSYFIIFAWVDRFINQYLIKYGLFNMIKIMVNSIKILKLRISVIETFELPY